MRPQRSKQDCLQIEFIYIYIYIYYTIEQCALAVTLLYADNIYSRIEKCCRKPHDELPVGGSQIKDCTAEEARGEGACAPNIFRIIKN